METTQLTRTPYELAMLAGGPQRLLDVALTTMIRSKRLRVSRDRLLTVVEPVADHPVERAVLDTIGPAGRATVSEVRRLAPDHPEIAMLRARLIAEGLLRGTSPGWFGRVLLGRRSGRLTPAGRRLLRMYRAEEKAGSAEMRVAVLGLGSQGGKLPNLLQDPRRHWAASGGGGGGGSCGCGAADRPAGSCSAMSCGGASCAGGAPSGSGASCGGGGASCGGGSSCGGGGGGCGGGGG